MTVRSVIMQHVCIHTRQKWFRHENAAIKRGQIINLNDSLSLKNAAHINERVTGPKTQDRLQSGHILAVQIQYAMQNS